MNHSLQRAVMVAACVVTLGVGTLLRPAAAQDVASGAFRDLSGIEKTLLRGVTTKAQVRRQLGIPNGSGAARFASLGGDEREIWYYEDIQMTGARSEEQSIKLAMRQQILLVLFKGEVVDGYLWTSNSGTGVAR